MKRFRITITEKQLGAILLCLNEFGELEEATSYQNQALGAEPKLNKSLEGYKNSIYFKKIMDSLLSQIGKQR